MGEDRGGGDAVAGHRQGPRPVLSARRYRLLDVATKVAGVVLVGVALEVGPTTTGLLLGAAGVLLATSTVFVHQTE